MKEEERKETEQYLADAITERPYGFGIGDRHFYIYPVTLGKMYVLQRYVEQLELDASRDISVEALRIAKEKKDICLSIIYIHSCRTKDEVFDVQRMDDTKAFFSKELSEADIASLLIMVLSTDKTDKFMKFFGIDKEQADMRKVMDVKDKSDNNSYCFGGLTIYGSFIHPLMEMGMSWDEIVWCRSYTNLRMLLADKVNSVYVTDEERKKIHISKDRNRVDGDNREAVMRAIQSESWE